MAATVIDGKASAAKLREKIAALTAELKSEHGIQPGLATVLVGNDPASEVYVRNKRKTAEAIGFNSVHVELAANRRPGRIAGAGEGAVAPTIPCMASWCSCRCPNIWTKMPCWMCSIRPRMWMR